MKTKTPITFLAAAFVAAGLLTVAQAQTNSFDGTYSFAGSTGNTNSLPYNGDPLANVTAGNIIKSAGITNSSSSGNFRATGWTTGGSIDLGDYISFTLEADTGYLFDLTDMTFGVGRSATGTRNWVWYASTNSFSTSFVLTNYSNINAGLSESGGVLTNPDLNSNWTGNVLDLSDLTGLSQIEFRLYSYNSEAAGGTAGLAGNLNFTGVSYSSGPPPAGDDLYWTANGTTLGGAGTWNTSGTNWSPTDSPVAADVWDSTKKAIFTNSAATVTVDDVSVEKGIQFATTGYVLEDGTITLDGATIGDNTITTDADVTATIDSILSGTNGLTKAGTGTLVVGGSNDYSGGTLVSAGRLVGTTGSLQGDVTNNAAVTFAQTTNGTYADDMSGTGSLTKEGAGTVTLGGNNSYSGGTLVSAGHLIGTTGSLQGDITNNAAVTFAQTTNGTYAGELSGTGSVAKAGAGTVTFSGNNSYEGGTTVNGGTLIAAGDSALGTDSVTITEGTVLAKDGVTTANDFVIGTASGGGTPVWVAGWDFQTTTHGGTATAASPSTPDLYLANFGDQAGEATLYLNGTNGSSAWTTLTAFGGATVNTTNTAVSGSLVMSTVTSGASSLALTNNSANGQSIVFAFDMTGLKDLDLSYASQGSASGFLTQEWAYSTNGSTWTSFWTNTFSGATTFTGNGIITPGSVITDLDGASTAYLRLTVDGATNASGNNRLDNIILNATSTGEGSGSGTVGINEEGLATFTGDITVNHDGTFTAAADGVADFSGVISGGGAIDKTGAGTVTFSGSSANTQTGAVTVSAGVLELAKTAGTAAITGNLTVQDGARLLLSTSNQVADTSAVTLSGGTIERASGVSEVFGDLNLTEASFLDYGTGSTGTLTFGSYTPSSLLTVSNFLEGNTLVFSSNLTGQITGNFNFDNGFTTDWNGSTFTITAIPEPAAYAVAAGLIGLMLWPTRRRLLKDAKSILGLRPPARDRLTKRA